MLNNSRPTIILAAVWVLTAQPVAAVDERELETLFTTPQERQLINANRYRQEPGSAARVKPADEPKPIAIREIIREEVNRSYRITGISVNTDGSGVAWINGEMVDDGARLADGARVRINHGRVKSITITTPDGKQHRGTSGETLAVTYMRAAEE